MIHLPYTLRGQVTLMSAGLMVMFVAGTALSASEPVSTPKSDRAPLSHVADESCGGQTWPNIDKACLETVASTGAAVASVRYITVARAEGDNTTVLHRIPVTQQADAR